jgi:hypothetical protein
MGCVRFLYQKENNHREQKFLREKLKEYDDFDWKLKDKNLDYVIL